MLAILLTLTIGFFVGEAIGYFIHRMLHSPLSGMLHQKHMMHHLKLYPITDFYSEKYRSPGKDSTFFIFSAIIFTASILMFIFLPLRMAMPVSIEFLILGLINDYLHDIFHIHPNWLEKSELFQKLRSIHYQHHVDMGTNFGIYTFLTDRALGTFRLRD